MSKTADTLRRQTYKTELNRTLELNSANGNVEVRYKLILWLLCKEWGSTLSKVEKELMVKILKDAVYIDRIIRLKTCGREEELKEILSQEFQIAELGMEVGSNLKI